MHPLRHSLVLPGLLSARRCRGPRTAEFYNASSVGTMDEATIEHTIIVQIDESPVVTPPRTTPVNPTVVDHLWSQVKDAVQQARALRAASRQAREDPYVSERINIPEVFVFHRGDPSEGDAQGADLPRSQCPPFFEYFVHSDGFTGF